VQLFSAQRRRETAKPLQFLEIMNTTFNCGGNTRQRSAKCEASQRKFTGPKTGRFPETDDAVLTFFQERQKTGLVVSYDLLRKKAIKKSRSLNIPQKLF
jgi:hypothetical protein